MTTTPATPNRYSVMLTVDSQGYSPSTVELAVAMAAAVQSGLRGLFIEDEDLLRVAALPFTREICFATARARATDVPSMQRSLRARSSQFRQYLGSRASASRVVYSCESISGRTRAANLAALPEVDFLILGMATSNQHRAPRGKGLRRVLLIADHSPHLLSALQLLINWAAPDRLAVTVVAAAGSQGWDDTPQLRDQLGASGRGAVVERDRRELAQLLDADYDYVIASRQEPATSLEHLLSTANCPVILVSETPRG